MKAIINGTILQKDGEVRGKALLFDERIVGVADEKEALERADTVLDARGMYVSPGFVDVHIHGYLGQDTSDGSAQGIKTMAEGILKNGVTSFLPTTMTVAWAQLEKVFDVIAPMVTQSEKNDFIGAQILGVHAEGPFINPKKKGAQPEDAILAPDADRLLPYKGLVRLVTMAPEMAGGNECVRRLREEGGMVVSIGHTGATFEQAMAAIDAGAGHITHTFNAMTPLNHRDPGVVGAALTSDADCELIADTFHIHPGIFELLVKCKGDRLVLITDCTRAGGLSDGEYTLGGQPIFVKGIECRLADGTIAGSVLKMNQAVKNLYEHTSLPVYGAVRCASLNAARAIGADGRKGSLEAGKDADIILFDGNFTVRKAFVRGVCKYEM